VTGDEEMTIFLKKKESKRKKGKKSEERRKVTCDFQLSMIDVPFK